MKDQVNPDNLATTIPPLEATQALQTLQDAKVEVLAAEGKQTQYIKAKVFKHHKDWWDKIERDLKSEDKDVARAAMIEFNKLQCRVLPTELTSPEDGGLIMKLVSYKEAEENNNISN